MKASKQSSHQPEQFTAPAMSDEECADRLATGYKQSFDEDCLITWDEMEQRIGKLFERKQRQSA